MKISSSTIAAAENTVTSTRVMADDSINSTTNSNTENEMSSTTNFVFWNVAQPKTSYPQLVLPELDLITDDGSASGSDNEENSVQREKYSTKVDQDVAIFMMIAEKLSVTSLVHLLQGHVRSQQSHTWHYDTMCALEIEKERRNLIEVESSSSSSSSSYDDLLVRPTKKRRKSFRFATIRNGDVRTIVHEIEPIAPEYIQDIWWNGDEMMSFRCNAIETVRHYRKHRTKYIEAIESIMISSGSSSSSTSSTFTDSTTGSQSSDVSANVATTENTTTKIPQQHKKNQNNITKKNIYATVESAVKVLTLDSYARGLETHICTILSRTRTEMIEALLEEQIECKKCHDSYDISAESLRGQSLAYSTASAQFAIALGQVDQIEALKAAMSIWTPEL